MNKTLAPVRGPIMVKVLMMMMEARLRHLNKAWAPMMEMLGRC